MSSTLSRKIAYPCYSQPTTPPPNQHQHVKHHLHRLYLHHRLSLVTAKNIAGIIIHLHIMDPPSCHHICSVYIHQKRLPPGFVAPPKLPSGPAPCYNPKTSISTNTNTNTETKWPRKTTKDSNVSILVLN